MNYLHGKASGIVGQEIVVDVEKTAIEWVGKEVVVVEHQDFVRLLAVYAWTDKFVKPEAAPLAKATG